MAYTEPTTINATRGIVAILEYVNEVTNFWISRMLILAIFVIFLAGYLRSNKDDFLGGFAIASYSALVIGLLFFIIGFLDGVTFGFVIGATLIASILLFLDRRGG